MNGTQRVWHFLFGDWRRTVLLLILVLVLALTGVLNTLFQLVLVNVFLPLIYGVVIVVVLVTIIKTASGGGKSKR